MTEVSLETPPPRAGEEQDSGSLAVLAETAYPANVASARVRIANFAPFLQEQGVKIDYRPALTNADYELLSSSGRIARKAGMLGRVSVRAVLGHRPEHDLLLVHRLRLLNPFPGFDPPRRLDVYDIDDPLFVRFSGGVNRRFRWTKRETARCVECLRRARLVLAGNSYLADRARAHAARVEVLPSCVDPFQQPTHVHREQHPVTVGWIGSPSTSPYLRQVLPVFAQLNSVELRARLVLVGADPGLTAPWIEHRRWSLASERDDLASFDIGIAPQSDDEWARGKCGYKILQYFAAGIPAVASPVGVAAGLIGADRGVLAETPEQWRRGLLSLIDDAQRRAEQGVAGRGFVERHYSYKRWAPELASLLRSLAS